MKIYNYFKNIVEENISQEFRLKNILFLWRNRAKSNDEQKAQKVCKTLNYTEHFLFLASTITRCISISAFASLLGTPIGITSSTTGLNICAKAAGINPLLFTLSRALPKNYFLMKLSSG